MELKYGIYALKDRETGDEVFALFTPTALDKSQVLKGEKVDIGDWTFFGSEYSRTQYALVKDDFSLELIALPEDDISRRISHEA